MLQPSDHPQHVHALLMVCTAELDAVFHVVSHKSRIEKKNLVPHLLPPPPQDTVGFLGCECTLLAHVQLFVHQSHTPHYKAIAPLIKLQKCTDHYQTALSNTTK